MTQHTPQELKNSVRWRVSLGLLALLVFAACQGDDGCSVKPFTCHVKVRKCPRALKVCMGSYTISAASKQEAEKEARENFRRDHSVLGHMAVDAWCTR